jgi:hypothetical protein
MTNRRSAAQSTAAAGKTTITKLVCRRQWYLLAELLRHGDSVIPIDDAIRHSITRDLLVHFVCRFQAPTSIVRIVAQTYGESLQCTDALGRFPIHVSQKIVMLVLSLRSNTHNIFHSRSHAHGEHPLKLSSFYLMNIPSRHRYKTTRARRLFTTCASPLF